MIYPNVFRGLLTTLGLILLCSSAVRADDIAETIEDWRAVSEVDEYLPNWDEAPASSSLITRPDTAANTLQNRIESLIRGNGDWSFEFVWVRPRGTSIILSHMNRFESMIPASTAKLFTGWVAFEKKLASHSYIRTMLQESDNAMANRLLRKIGGKTALQRTIQDTLDLDPASSRLAIRDGSGLSARNRSSANHQFRLLRHIRLDSKYPTFKKLLASPGKSGTLASRLTQHRGRIFAKTGTLPQTGVCALAGFAETPKGTIIFSIIGNDLTRSTNASRRVIDQIVDLNIRYLNALRP